MDRRPLSLLESAESCRASLEELKKHASDSKAKHTHSTKKRQLLEKVNSEVCPFTVRYVDGWLIRVGYKLHWVFKGLDRSYQGGPANIRRIHYRHIHEVF